MSPITWPKIIKVEDVVTATDSLAAGLEALSARVAENRALIDTIVAAQQHQIDELEHFAAEHQAGAAERQRELDQLKAETERTRWSLRTGRKP